MPYKIIKADIIEWLKEYQGEPFHAMLFDPPYHLTSIVERFEKDEPEHTKTAKDIANRSTPIARLAKGFMGKNWDGGDLIFQPSTWLSLSTVLHPGAFVMAYCSSRGWHRQAVAMEDGGMIFHPSIFMFGMGFGSGFPKATRIDTQIDAMAGEEREVVESRKQTQGPRSLTRRVVQKEQEYRPDGPEFGQLAKDFFDITKPATPLAESWQGHRYGLQLIKPSLEPILVGQKPYQGKPVENIVETGAGAINVDGGRVGTENRVNQSGELGKLTYSKMDRNDSYTETNGRWPASLILHHLPECKRVGTKRVRGNNKPSQHDRKEGNLYMINEWKPSDEGDVQRQDYADSDGYETVTEWQCVEGCPIKIIGEQSEESETGGHYPDNSKVGQGITYGQFKGNSQKSKRLTDSGTAARYFQQPDWSYEIYEQLNNADLLQYITKPSTTEREAGLEKLPFGIRNRVNSGGYEADPKFAPVERKNTHPTVKSIALNKYLATLLLPPPEYALRRILVPFCGSGSEVIGCLLAGWDEVIGIELEQEYYDIASERVAWWYSVMESCNFDVDNIIKHWQEEQKLKESGQMRLL